MTTCQRCPRKVLPPSRVCAKCQKAQARDSYLRRTYGISLSEYDAIKEAQGGRCYLCRRATGKTKNLAVDHDHALGYTRAAVRGLLCSLCNKGVVGHFRDDPAAGLRLHEYLTNPPARRVLEERDE